MYFSNVGFSVLFCICKSIASELLFSGFEIGENATQL